MLVIDWFRSWICFSNFWFLIAIFKAINNLISFRAIVDNFVNAIFAVHNTALTVIEIISIENKVLPSDFVFLKLLNESIYRN